MPGGGIAEGSSALEVGCGQASASHCPPVREATGLAFGDGGGRIILLPSASLLPGTL